MSLPIQIRSFPAVMHGVRRIIKAQKGLHLSILNGSSYVMVAAAGTTVDGAHGTLVIHSDGAYTYTPDTTAIAGQQDSFSYMLTQPDGDSNTASLVINISDTPYVAATPISGFEGTSADDVILGGDADDALNGNAGNDHLEGGKRRRYPKWWRWK